MAGGKLDPNSVTVIDGRVYRGSDVTQAQIDDPWSDIEDITNLVESGGLTFEEGGDNADLTSLLGGGEEAEPTGIETATQTATDLLDPYIGAGEEALADMMDMPDFVPPEEFSYDAFESPEDFEFNLEDVLNDPGYNFRLEQGQKAIERSASAAGRLKSGRLMKEMTAYSSGLASQETQAAYGRQFNTWGANYQKAVQDYGIGRGAALEEYKMGYEEKYRQHWDKYNALGSIAGAGITSASTLAGLEMTGAIAEAGQQTSIDLANIGAASGMAIAKEQGKFQLTDLIPDIGVNVGT